MRFSIPVWQAARWLGLLALVTLLCAVPTASAATRGQPRDLAKHGGLKTLYWGAQIDAQLTGEKAPWDMSAVRKFERLAGKGLSLVEFSSPWSNCFGGSCVFQLFPTTPLENVRQYGAIPIFSWNSSASPPSIHQPDFQLADVISGRYDVYVRRFAEEAKAWGHPFFLRFNWEMNGFWFPWSEGVNGNRPGEYVAAWRHVHDIFTSVGATNATWTWCPNVDIFGELNSLKPLYPGSRYVDWTCIDGFNWGRRRGSPGWLSFNRIFHPTYRQIVREVAPHKPMILAEVASSDRGGSKAGWIKDMLRKVRTRYGKVRGMVWYDVNDRGAHWPIETSRGATRAFRSGIRARAFLPNVFGSIASAVPPPPRG